MNPRRMRLGLLTLVAAAAGIAVVVVTLSVLVRPEARARWEHASLQLRTQIEAQVFLAEDAARQSDLYRTSLLPRAEEVVQLTLASYRAGNASALDWIDVQRTLLALRRAYWRAQLDQQQAQVELRTLTAEAVR